MIYRVKTETTGSLQPRQGDTYWKTEVLYCGADVEDARIAYHESKPADYGAGYGNSARYTIFERLDTSELNGDDPGDDWVNAE